MPNMSFSLNNLMGAVTNAPITSIPIEVREGVTMAFAIMMVLASIAMIVVVLLQKGTNDNVGVIAGGSDNFYGKNKRKGKDALLKRITFGIFGFIIVCAIICFVINVID